MAAREPTFWELVVEAFHRKPPNRKLGPVPWNKVALIATAILGLGNPGFWLLGVAGELAYLYLSANSPRFRNLVRAKRLEGERTSTEQQIETWLAELSPAGKGRFEALTASCRDVQKVYETLRPGGLSVIDEQRWRGLDQLLWLSLRLSVSLELLERQMGAIDPRGLQGEVEELRTEIAALAPTSEALRKSRQSLLELKQRRLENLGRAGEARQILSSELQRVEQQVELLREEAAMSRDAESLSARIDSVAGTLSENDSWMRQHEEFLSDLGVEGNVTPPKILQRSEVEGAP
jgi:chromosome segregation ATPase